jgi:hypothetical protein
MPRRESSWRPIARFAIRKVILRHRELLNHNGSWSDPRYKALRAALRQAYPFLGRGWKYAVWLQEIDRQQRLFHKWEQWELQNGNISDARIVAWLKGEA